MYEVVLMYELRKLGLDVGTLVLVPLPMTYEDVRMDMNFGWSTG